VNEALRLRLLDFLRVIEKGANVSCQVAVALMTCMVAVQVVLRYVFRAPIPWVEEATVFLMIWMTFIGAGVALRSGAHIAMTILRERLPAQISRFLAIFSHIVILAFLLLLIWEGSLLVVLAEGQRSPALGIPMQWPYLTMPLGACFMVTQLVAVMLERKAPVASAAEPLQ
jgi:TRAP-type C4-dicarboxylate transport system permease small subunit